MKGITYVKLCIMLLLGLRRGNVKHSYVICMCKGANKNGEMRLNCTVNDVINEGTCERI
jgi:hypothetical protein